MFPTLVFRLLNHAQLEILAFQRAVREFMLTIDDAYGKQFEEFYVGFEGSFGGKHVTPRSISARHLGNLVCVEGIVTKCKPNAIGTFHGLEMLASSPLFHVGSLVRPKVVKSVHFCPATKKTIERKYTDLTSLDPFPSSGVYPTKVHTVRAEKSRFHLLGQLSTNICKFVLHFH